MRFLEREQSDEERYQRFLARETQTRGKVMGWLMATLLTAWARITEDELGTPLEPGETWVELESEQAIVENK